MRQLTQFIQHRFGYDAVRTQDNEGLIFYLITAEMKSGDVDVILSECRPDVADDAGAVIVGKDQHVTFRNHFQREFINLDDAGILADIDDPAAYGRLTGAPI